MKAQAKHIHNHDFNSETKSTLSSDTIQKLKEIKSFILPKTMPITQKLEIGIFHESSSQTGGNFFDTFSINDRKMAFVMGNITDHKLSSLVTMTQCLSHIRAFLKSDFSLMSTIERTNQFLLEVTPKDVLVTLFCAIYDSLYGQLTFISAGHTPPILMRTSLALPFSDVPPLSLLTSEGMALNCVPHVVLEEKKIQLFNGDILILQSQGIIDAENENHENYGEGRLKNFILEHHNLPAAGIAQALGATLHSFLNHNLNLDDDLTALIIKFKEGAKHESK